MPRCPTLSGVSSNCFAQHPINQLQIVAHPMLQLFGQDFFLFQQPVLLLDKDFHPLDGSLQGIGARGCRDSLRENIGKSGQEIDIVLVVIMLLVVVDLQHAIGLVVAALDNDVDGRDDAVLGIECRQLEIVVIVQIVADRGLAGDEGTPLRRGDVGTRDDFANDTRMPAVSGLDQKVVLFGAVAAHLGKRHTETFRTDPRRFRQDFHHIALAKRKAAKVGNRRLLVKKFADLDCVCAIVTHVRTARVSAAGFSRANP